MNLKKPRRIYRGERLQARRRSGRKRALGTRAPIASPQGPHVTGITGQGLLIERLICDADPNSKPFPEAQPQPRA